jgi:hypothetical protein
MLCLWHVRKASKENAIQNIKDETLCVCILKVVEDIMYSNDYIQGEAAVTDAKLKLLACGMISHLVILSIISRRHGVERLQCG